MPLNLGPLVSSQDLYRIGALPKAAIVLRASQSTARWTGASGVAGGTP
jgi:hypothetical protein